eukprot:PhM_4_TR15393/c0_g1_i1/m.12984
MTSSYKVLAPAERPPDPINRSSTVPLVDVGRTRHNNAIFHAMDAVKSEVNRTDGALMSDMQRVLGGNCVYLPHFLEPNKQKQFALLEQLKGDLLEYADAVERGAQEVPEQQTPDNERYTAGPDYTKGMVRWSKHLKHENPSFSSTFNTVIATLSEYFDVDVFASRMNYYPDGSSWKPFHKDSHAYGQTGHKEDFTIGLSLGNMRNLAFQHEDTEMKFMFPQKDGDVFAFSSDVNEKFLHGVPKAGPQAGERISIIMWGKRRSLNLRNSNVAPITRMPKAGETAALKAVTCAMTGRPRNNHNNNNLRVLDVTDEKEEKAKKLQKEQDKENKSENGETTTSTATTATSAATSAGNVPEEKKPKVKKARNRLQ